MYLAENCTDRKDTCIVHGWLIYSTMYRGSYIYGWILYRVQRYMSLVGYCTGCRDSCTVHGVYYAVYRVQYIYVVGYYTRYRGICTWLDTGQAEEVHVQYTAGYIYRYMVR
jgi:hypothetical protein